MKGFPHVEFRPVKLLLSNCTSQKWVTESDSKESMTCLGDFSTDHFHTPNTSSFWYLICFYLLDLQEYLGIETHANRIIFLSLCIINERATTCLGWYVHKPSNKSVIYNRSKVLIRTFAPARLPTRSCVKRHHKHGHDLVFFLPLILHCEERNVRIWNEMLPNNHRLRAARTSIPSGDNSC